MAIRNIPNDELEVPPNTVVRTDGYFRLPRNARIDAFQPHMHMRGRGMTLEAIDPANNRTQILSSVDHFDFNWHINYVYADDAAPLLPAGTVLHMIGIHDNTSANRRNPDPEHVGRLRRAQRGRHAAGLAQHRLSGRCRVPAAGGRAQGEAARPRRFSGSSSDSVPDRVAQAGGIAFRGDGRDLSILLVTLEEAARLLDLSEGPHRAGRIGDEAALRETVEEAGVDGELDRTGRRAAGVPVGPRARTRSVLPDPRDD